MIFLLERRAWVAVYFLSAFVFHASAVSTTAFGSLGQVVLFLFSSLVHVITCNREGP